MALAGNEIAPYASELDRLQEGALYSAQAYFEATKFADLVGRLLVFLPAICSAISGVLISVGWDRAWGVVSAVAGAVAATASYLGSERKASSFKSSARRYTALRHKLRFEASVLINRGSIAEVEERVQGLESEYLEIVSGDEPVPNFLYERARRRITGGSV